MPKSSPVEETQERPRCPACRVELRIRDDKGAAPVFACPECQIPLRLDRGEDGLLTVVLAEAPVRAKRSRQPSNPPRRVKSPPAATPPDRTLLWFGLGIAGVCAVVILWLSTGRPPQSRPIETVSGQHDAEQNPATPAVASDATLEEGLAELNRRIQSACQDWIHFPSATDAENALPHQQQLSWLARLEARSATLPPERRPVLDVPWNDPANEPFVGRRVPAYLNPHVSAVVGDNGRPTTHFVGVAGVGQDAAELPLGHFRAGLFGTKRTVTTKDLHDGQANTLMVLGVDTRLGSWADPGHATVRPLTQPPYLHGPDGFGGGAGQPLPALMADGSVRSFAADTDPRLLRRLAAIADGLPLDITVPGEPGDTPPPGSLSLPDITRGVVINDPDHPPLSALAAIAEAQRPTIVRPPVAPLLQQRLVSFQQTKPTTRRQLLFIAEDLLGRPVVIDQESLGPLTSQLDAKVSFSLEETTVAAVLEQLLTGTELELVIGPDSAVVRRRAAATSASVRIEP